MILVPKKSRTNRNVSSNSSSLSLLEREDELTNNIEAIDQMFSVIKQHTQTFGCPPTELVRPCRCLKHINDLFSRTLLMCNGTEFKYERRFENILLRLSKRLGNRHSKYFDWLYLINLENVRKITKNFFAGFRFRHLIIEDAPNLKHLHPSAFKSVTNLLRYFYAYNTGLEHYRSMPSKLPLGSLRNLTEVHIVSKRNICPPKEIIFPCECSVRNDQLMPFSIKRQILQIRCTHQRGIDYDVTKIFNRLNKLKVMGNGNSINNNNNSNNEIRQQHPQWYFDEIILKNVTKLGSNSFGTVDFGELFLEQSPQLTSIASDAFQTESTIQKLRISGVNLSNDNLAETFEAINRLKYLRSLFIWSSTIEFVPEMAFSQLQFYLKEIVLYGNNIKAIGSFAFANLPNLDELRIDGNNIILVDKYAFATNFTSQQPLRLTMIANNLDETSFAFMSMNGAQRPIHLSFAEIGGCYWQMKYLDEQIFAPFLDKTSNRIFLEPECELDCFDCRMRWLTEIPRHAQRRINLLKDSSFLNHYDNQHNEQQQRSTINLDDLVSNKQSIGFVPCKNGENLFDVQERISKHWNNCINFS
ncbi:Nose resistant to fluoxetine protein 6 [Sarcoptes scabiei]|nr:Nose resistant to fluoxetine protein 6 [Sarcoptes scabiei]